MFKILALTLLLLIMLENSTGSPTWIKPPPAGSEEFLSIGFTQQEIRKCRCIHAKGNKWLCPKGPVNEEEKGNLKKCLCKQKAIYCLPEFQDFCGYRCFPLPPVPPLSRR